MSHHRKREIVETILPGYLKADRAGKDMIFDEFVSITGYHRKYAIRLLKHGPTSAASKSKPGRKRVYQGDVIVMLEEISKIHGQICSKHFHPFMKDGMQILGLNLLAYPRHTCDRSQGTVPRY